MADCWIGKIVAMRAGSTVMSWVYSMVGWMADCWAGRMVAMRVGWRAG